MPAWQIILIAFGCLLFIIIAIVLIRTFTYKEKDNNLLNESKEEVDKESVNRFCDLIKIPTIASFDESKTNYEPFKELIEKIKVNYPLVFQKAYFEQASDFGLFFKIKGKSDKKPSVLMAHYDVVPAEGEWSFQPFSGTVKDDYILGRGTLDTKSTFAGVLEALNELLKNDYIPENDLYLCFGSNEEVYGNSCKSRVDWFKKNNIKPNIVLDEGGAIVDKVFPGVNKKSAMIGVTEKGLAYFELQVKTSGGHSSTPNKNGSVVQLAKAIIKLEKKPMKSKYTQTVYALFHKMGLNATFTFKMIFANLWLFKGLLKTVFKLLGGEPAALMKTTFAFTTLEGSKVNNAMPALAIAGINVRISPFNTLEEVTNHIKKVVGKNITVKLVNGFEASLESSSKNEQFSLIENTIKETFNKDIICAPYIMLGATDSRHFTTITNNVYRFSPMYLTKKDRKTIHGIDECISVDNYLKCVEFYKRLMKKL